MICKICNPELEGDGICAKHSSAGTSYMPPKTNNSWEKEFDRVRNDGEHASIDDQCLNEYDVIMLKDIIRDLFTSERQRLREKIKSKNINGVHLLDNQVEVLLKLLNTNEHK